MENLLTKSMSKLAGLAAYVWAASALAVPAAAFPINGYQGQLSPGVVVNGAVAATTDQATGVGFHFWSFAGTAGSVITITGHRAEFGFDMSFALFEGIGTDTNNLSPLESADDEVPEPPGLEGPFSDPQLSNFTLPSTGFYTVMVFDGAVGILGDINSVDGLYAYTLVADGFDGTVAVPEPATFTVFGVGLAALGLARRRRRAGP